MIFSSWGSHKLQELTKNFRVTKTIMSNTKSNKLLSLHLTHTKFLPKLKNTCYTQMGEIFMFESIFKLWILISWLKHSLLFSRVDSGIQGVKGIINDPGVSLYMLEKPS